MERIISRLAELLQMKNKLKVLTTLVVIFTALSIKSSADESGPWPVIYSHGPSTGKYVALTFDDAPSGLTPDILHALENADIKATFFVEGQHASLWSGMLSEIVAGGHELGNHSFTHPNLNKLGEDEIEEELVETNYVIFTQTGVIPHLFRPPGGHRDSRTDRIAYENEMTTVMWTVNSGDYRRSSERIKDIVLGRVGPGGIILLHDSTESTLEILPEIIQTLKARGYRFVTVGQMLEMTHGRCQWVTDEDEADEDESEPENLSL